MSYNILQTTFSIFVNKYKINKKKRNFHQKNTTLGPFNEYYFLICPFDIKSVSYQKSIKLFDFLFV